MPDASGSSGACVLLEEDHLLDERGAASAVLGRPAEADPAVAAELLLPRPAFVEAFVLVARAAASAHRRERSVEAVGEPRARVAAEPLLRGGEVQVQAAGRYQSVFRMLRPNCSRASTAHTGGVGDMEPTGTAVVTGAGRGIGRAVAIELARAWVRRRGDHARSGTGRRHRCRGGRGCVAPGRAARRQRPCDDEHARRTARAGQQRRRREREPPARGDAVRSVAQRSSRPTCSDWSR